MDNADTVDVSWLHHSQKGMQVSVDVIDPLSSLLSMEGHSWFKREYFLGFEHRLIA